MPPVDVLLVEDNSGDRDLTHEAFRLADIRCHLHAVEDGEQALAFLRCTGPYETAPRPALVLLDLNLPRKSGHEVLREIKSDARLRKIPVVIMTTSDSDSDLENCYHLGANSYITKPVDFDVFTGSIRALGEFWFSVAKLPAAG